MHFFSYKTLYIWKIYMSKGNTFNNLNMLFYYYFFQKVWWILLISVTNSVLLRSEYTPNAKFTNSDYIQSMWCLCIIWMFKSKLIIFWSHRCILYSTFLNILEITFSLQIILYSTAYCGAINIFYLFIFFSNSKIAVRSGYYRKW